MEPGRPCIMAAMATARIHGVQLHFEIVGEGGPWLALITGGRRSYAEFVPLAGRIAGHGYRVVLHDRRNTGASQIVVDAGDDDLGEEEIWTDDVVALMDHLGASPAVYGGASSGARTCLLTCLRHPEAVRALVLMRVTGGAFAARRLPEMYYSQFIRAAREGGMAAVCATEQIRERIAAHPPNGPYLAGLDPERYIAVMSRWLAKFESGLHSPVMGVTDAELASIAVPTLVVPGNDRTHSSSSALAAARQIPGSTLFRLPIEDEDIPLIPFSDWAAHEPALAQRIDAFLRALPRPTPDRTPAPSHGR